MKRRIAVEMLTESEGSIVISVLMREKVKTEAAASRGRAIGRDFYSSEYRARLIDNALVKITEIINWSES